ncbi:MAG: hypothetical protein BGO57_00845 [Sphingomonadales bacterium 63-6]|nr:MAG: hypothetical protein BGO57_00845 [Sphingomonadales bacterium 63-6]
MAHAAQLGALAIIDARLVDLQNLFVQAARHSVKLEPERRDREGVNHVSRSGLDADRNADGNDHAMIDLKVRGEALSLGFFFRHHVRDNFEAAIVGIGVAPVPLVASDLHRQGILGCALILFSQQVERRDRDQHEDQDGNARPEHFEQRVVARLRRHGIRAAIEADHHEYQQCQNQHDNCDNNGGQHNVMHPAGIVTDGRILLLQPDRAGLGLALDHVRAERNIGRSGGSSIGGRRSRRSGRCGCFLSESRLGQQGQRHRAGKAQREGLQGSNRGTKGLAEVHLSDAFRSLSWGQARPWAPRMGPVLPGPIRVLAPRLKRF